MVRAKEQQKIVSQAEYTGKRKDSTSQILSSVSCDTPAAPAPIGRGKSNSHSSLRSPVRSLVADYDPINDHHGSLTHGYEPTAKGLQGMSECLSEKTFPSIYSSVLWRISSAGKRSFHSICCSSCSCPTVESSSTLFLHGCWTRWTEFQRRRHSSRMWRDRLGLDDRPTSCHQSTRSITFELRRDCSLVSPAHLSLLSFCLFVWYS